MLLFVLAAAVQLRGPEGEQKLLNAPPEHGGHADAHGDAHGAALGDAHGAALGDAHGDAHGAAHGDAHGDVHGDAHGAAHGDAHGDAHGAHAPQYGVPPAGHDPLEVEHGEGHGEHDSHAHHAGEDCSGASSVAVGLFSTVALVPFVFTLTQSGGVITKLTWRFIDFFVSVFLAILWFGAFSDILTLDFFASRAGPITLAAAQVLILYTLALVFAYYLKDNIFRLITFASCGAHYIAFAGIAAGETTQRAHFSDEEWHTFVFAGLALAILAALFVVAFRFRSGVKGEYNAAIDELEIDIAGLVGSYLITQSIRTTLTGHYPSPHLLQMAGHHEVTHTATERGLMFGWAVLLLCASGVLVPMVMVWAHDAEHTDHLGAGHTLLPSKWQHKFAHFVKILVIMCAAWAFLLWGEWEFHIMFHGDPLFGHMVFALLATLVCLVIVLAVGKMCKHASDPVMRAAETSCIGLGLVGAWAWEHCFDMALGVLGQKYQVGYGGLVPKITLALLIPCFVLPVYINYVKPKVLEIEHEEEKEAKHGH